MRQRQRTGRVDLVRRGAHRLLRGMRVFALLVAAASCEGIDDIDVESEARARVPARTLLDEVLGVIPLEGFDEASFERELRNQGVAEDDVDSVRLTRFALVVESPPGQALDFIERAAFYVSADDLPEVRIAHVESVPAGATSVQLALDGVELEPYVTAPSLRIRAELQGGRPESATTVRADLVLEVDITVPGC